LDNNPQADSLTRKVNPVNISAGNLTFSIGGRFEANDIAKSMRTAWTGGRNRAAEWLKAPWTMPDPALDLTADDATVILPGALRRRWSNAFGIPGVGF